MQLTVVDSHTGGEPTRVVVEGFPSLGEDSLAERRRRFAESFDAYRAAVVNEPRGSDVLVGAVLCPPHDPSCDVGVIFFNNVGVLGMCGHGAIGLAVTLRHLGRVDLGPVRLDTPVGVVTVDLLSDHQVAVSNVPSYWCRRETLEVEGYGAVTGDVAWGGNWFFLTKHAPVPIVLNRVDELTRFTLAIRRALERDNVTGDAGGEIDHIEVIGPPVGDADARNFVLCPGAAYDRSPCGTGTSAKVACLAATGELAPGEVWRQESVVGSVFQASYQWEDAQPEDLPRRVRPTIIGEAFVTAESKLLLNAADPFCWGLSGAHGSLRRSSDPP